MWVTPMKTCQNFQCQCQTYSATDSLFIYWIESVKKQDTPAISQFIHLTETSVACGRTKHSHNSLIFSSCLVTHCCGITSYSSTNIYYKAASVVVLVTLAGLAPSMLMPQAFSCVDIRTAGRSFHALHTYILDLVSDKLHSVWVKRLGGQRLFPYCGDMDCHWLQKLI